jgi:putative hemolysin
MRRVLQLHDLDQICENARRASGDATYFRRLLDALGLSYQCTAEDLARIPKTGPVVVVANHPFGLAEGPILGDLLLKARPDIRFMANSFLAAIPEIQPYLCAIDPFGGADAKRANWKSLRAGIAWLKQGGLLVVFPAGEVASLRLSAMKIQDPQWSTAIARLIRMTGASAVPLFFHGANSAGFQAAGLLHPRLRTAMLPHEFLNKRGRTIRLSIGRPVSARRISVMTGEDDTIDYLRHRTDVLRARGNDGHMPRPNVPWAVRRLAPIVSAGPSSEIRAEVGNLPESCRLVRQGEFSVILATANQIPAALREIGRLREVTFRKSGEGTGRAIDIDRFDAYYRHLFIWNEERAEVVGAYRFAATDRVAAERGREGLYTNSLFSYDAKFLAKLSPGLELGRSFVREEYQKSFQPLLLLWKGIGQVIVKSPRYRYLFGPVSISGDYNSTSRELMVSYLRTKYSDASLATLVRPKTPFRLRPLEAASVLAMCSRLTGLDDLGEIVSDVETGGRTIPVLLRQYLNLGGRIIEFNRDADFSGVVDGFVVVDLLETEPKLLERYLGREGAAEFLSFHHASPVYLTSGSRP